jgi:hypothetical protein
MLTKPRVPKSTNGTKECDFALFAKYAGGAGIVASVVG